MRKEHGTPLYIFSLNHNRDMTEAAIGEILGRPVTALQGCYEGVQEWSVLIPSDEFQTHRKALVALLNARSQQNALYLDGQRNAYLCDAPFFDHYVASKYIGEMVSRPLAEIVNRPNAYTIVGENLHYVR